MPVKRLNFCKSKWNHYIALTNKFAKTLFLLHLLDVDAAYQEFCNIKKKSAGKIIHAGIKKTIFLAGMWRVNPSIKLSCSLIKETNQVWLLQLCLPSLIGSGGIDDPKQFGALTFYTLLKKHGAF